MAQLALSESSAVHKLTDRALDLKDKVPTPIILIDGRAAAGKTRLANQLAEAVFQADKQLPKIIRMDDLYPGWEGLREGSHYLTQQILTPLSLGKAASWQIWDWELGERGNGSEPGNGWREFDGGNLLIIEGCGALSRQAAELTQLSVWVEVASALRKERFSNRDGNAFDGFWGIWAAQEDEFYQTESSPKLANYLVAN
jgi:uridine kinase